MKTKIILLILILMLSGKIFSQTQVGKCNYLIKETFPSSSIVVNGKKGSTSFNKSLSGLEIGVPYVLKFYQMRSPSSGRASGYWSVNFNGVLKKGPYVTLESGSVWKEVTFNFTPTSSSGSLSFNNGVVLPSPIISTRMLVADIRFYKEGECIFYDPLTCENTSSFKPKGKKKYIVSGWVKEERSQQVASYTTSGIKIGYGSSTVGTTFQPKGSIIDGWQLVQGIFEVGTSASQIQIELVPATDGSTTYFDDIRIHPFNGNMKSFVYDQDTQRLMAELDENNYATFYEYDKEGGLIRVKKETTKGVYTIQETRSGNSKLTIQQQ